MFSSDESWVSNDTSGPRGRPIPRSLSGRWQVVLVVVGIAVGAQAQSKSAVPTKKAATESAAGKSTFAARCAGCHGLDGTGGQRAPNIATNPTTRRLSDPELVHVISDGRTDFGMPAFRSMGSADIQNVVDYLRLLQGKGDSATLAGNPQQGKTLFFGKAGCSSCHAVAGHGTFVGSDLSTYARGLTSSEIRKAITDPASMTGKARIAVATTRDGKQWSGLVRNEDNFSLQMQSADGGFYFLMKADLDKLEYQPLPPMPSDYAQKLSQQEVDNLVGYLQSVKAEPGSSTGEDE